MLAFTLLRPPPTHGPFGRDFEAYYAAGATWSAGRDPWSRDVWRVERTIDGVDRGEEVLPYVGPAFALPLFAALARLPFAIAVRVWSALLALAFGALVLAALALAGERRVGALLGGLAFAGASAPAISDLALGQAAMLSAAGAAGGLVALHRRRVATAALGMLVAAVQPNLAVVLAARLRDRLALTASATALAAFALVTLLAGGGVPGLATYLGHLGEHGTAERFVAIQYTPAAIARAFGASGALASRTGMVVAAAAVIATVLVTVRARLDALTGTLLAIAALPLAVPFFHEHDFVIVLIPLIVLAVRTSGTARGTTGVAAALIAVDWFGLAQRPVADGQIVALGAAAALAFGALGPGRRATRADLAPLIAVAVLACAALPLARAHPAPTWPDALPASYRAPAGASAAETWADEQRVAGLTARDPAWAALRALPLAGCIVLGTAVVLGARARTRREDPQR